MAEHDLILHNGQVVTLDAQSRTVEAVAVTGTRSGTAPRSATRAAISSRSKPLRT